MDRNAATTQLATRMDAFLKFVRRQVGDPDLALDVLQDSFVKALAKAGELRDEDALVPWFYRVLRTTAADANRRRAAQARALRGLAAEPQEEEAGEVTPGQEAMVRACFENLLPQMTPAYAELIRDLELGGGDAAAYAEAHGMTAGALKTKRHRARRQLQELIESVCRCAIDASVDCVCGCR